MCPCHFRDVFATCSGAARCTEASCAPAVAAFTSAFPASPVESTGTVFTARASPVVGIGAKDEAPLPSPTLFSLDPVGPGKADAAAAQVAAPDPNPIDPAPAKHHPHPPTQPAPPPPRP